MSIKQQSRFLHIKLPLNQNVVTYPAGGKTPVPCLLFKDIGSTPLVAANRRSTDKPFQQFNGLVGVLTYIHISRKDTKKFGNSERYVRKK